MTTKTDITQERAAFELWASDQWYPLQRIDNYDNDYKDDRTQGVWGAWQARAAVEADRRAQIHDNAACASKLAESDKQDQFRDATKMVPSDASLEKAWDRFEAEMARCPTDQELEEFMAQYADEQGNIADDRHAEAARAVLSRYGDSQPTSCDCDDKSQCWEPCGELGHDAEHAKLSSGQPTASAEPVQTETITDGIRLPVDQMAGAAWNILDATGARVMIAGSLDGGKWTYRPALAAQVVKLLSDSVAAPVAQEPVIKEETSHEN